MHSTYVHHLAVFVFLLLLAIDEVKPQSTAMTQCPSIFKHGDNEFKCLINLASTACSPSPKKIQIYHTKNGVESLVKDSVYPPASCTATSDSIPNGEVQCTNKEDQTYTYLYKFVASVDTKEGETLQCRVPCFSGNATSGDACRIMFKESEDGSLTSGQIAGIVIGSIAGCAVLVLVIFGLVKLLKGMTGGGYAATST